MMHIFTKEAKGMKKAVIGGFLALIGSIWTLAVAYTACSNLVTEWHTELGRFWSTVIDMNLLPLMILSALMTVLGIVIMAVEFFRKDG